MNNYVLVKVTGKNVNNYIKWLIKNKINVIKLKIIKHDELNIMVDIKDYLSLTKYSKTYNVVIIKKYGKLRLFEIIKEKQIILISIMVGILFIYFCSSYIFSVQVVYNDQKMIALLEKELAKYGIVKFKHKPKADYLSKVKAKILADNKDTLEWLEIEERGTKYLVRLVERKQEEKIKEYQYQSVVAKKEATIVSIKAYAGERVKLVNEYVRSGDTIISGMISKPDGTIIYERAKGIVIGEVWYQIQIDYPLFYQEEKLTGKSKKTLALYFMNKELPILPYKRYKHFNKEGKVLWENNLIPFKLVKEKLYEVAITEEIYPIDEAILKAKEVAIKKLKDNSKAILNVKEARILDKRNTGSKIKLNLFVSVDEDITQIVPIKEIVEN